MWFVTIYPNPVAYGSQPIVQIWWLHVYLLLSAVMVMVTIDLLTSEYLTIKEAQSTPLYAVFFSICILLSYSDLATLCTCQYTNLYEHHILVPLQCLQLGELLMVVSLLESCAQLGTCTCNHVSTLTICCRPLTVQKRNVISLSHALPATL